MSDEIMRFVGGAIGNTDFECLRLAGDASTRKYFRIVFDSQSLVLMSWEPFADPAQYPFLNVLNHFAKQDIRVPRVEACSAALGVVLLEDLGDLTLERKFWENQDQNLALPFYFQAVDELIKIHFRASEKSPSGQPGSICQHIQFDTAKFMWEMNYAREHFLEGLAGLRLTDEENQRLQREFHLICETLHSQPKFVCHRDYHSRNLMLKLGRVYVIDFQDARLGPLQYDLCSLVHDSYVSLSHESIETIKHDYLAKAHRLGGAAARAIRPDFDAIFKIQIIQRCFKACGSFASFFNTRKDTRYLKYLKPTAQLVARELQADRRFPTLTEILVDRGLLERDYEALCAP